MAVVSLPCDDVITLRVCVKLGSEHVTEHGGGSPADNPPDSDCSCSICRVIRSYSATNKVGGYFLRHLDITFTRTSIC